jgi:predicted enzyme related to lactoylglutathione lyase
MDKVVHFEIPADDVERAKKFYSGNFGWKLTDMPEMQYVMAHTAETSADGMIQEKGVINGGLMKRGEVKNPVVVISVTSIDASLPKIESSGGKVVVPPMDIPGVGRYAYVSDTEGNVIGVIQPSR